MRVPACAGSCLRRNDGERGRRNDEEGGAGMTGEGSCLRRNDERGFLPAQE